MAEENVRVYTIKEIKPCDITCKEKGKKVFFEFKGNPIYLHTPKMRSPFYLSEKKVRATGVVFMKQISLSTEIYEGCDKNNAKYIKKFTEFLQQIDERILELLPKYNNNRFTMYKSLYTNPKTEYASTFNAGIKIDDSLNPLIDIYNQDRQPIECTTNALFKNKCVSGIVKLDNVWVSGDKIGVGWSAVQLKLEN